jgi:autotransporter-associated beta strand protein
VLERSSTNSRLIMKKQLLTLCLRSVCLLAVFLGILFATPADAGDATWLQTPVGNAWDDANNWMPNTVPNSTTDKATFGASDTTTVVVGSAIDVASLTFEPGASTYDITVTNGQTLDLWGSPNIINNSGVVQNFVAAGGTMYFHGTETLDSTIHFEAVGGSSTQGHGTIWFQGGVNLGTATMDIDGSDGVFSAGYVVLFAGNNAGSSTIVLHRGVNNGYGGTMTFESGVASSANITAEGSASKTRGAGSIYFSNAGSGSSTITLEGPIVQGGLGAVLTYSLFGGAEQSTLLADGGAISFTYASTGGTARISLTHRGSLDISDLRTEALSVTIGSLEGDKTGLVFLGKKKLIVGSNNTSTVFSGIIQDGGTVGGAGGSLEKIGTRTLTLTGASIYTGGTTITLGDFVVSNRTGSATGTGPVQVDAGRIGGLGTIAGTLTIGNSSGSAATLIPAIGTKKQVTTIVNSALTFNGGASYSCGVDTTQSSGDQVVANGVTINGGATFTFHSKGNGALPPGTVFTAINNTAATPITGNFSGLAEGSTITAGNNTYEISYAGGDGNDMTLTVL